VLRYQGWTWLIVNYQLIILNCELRKLTLFPQLVELERDPAFGWLDTDDGNVGYK
jgi:hypothetical protein